MRLNKQKYIEKYGEDAWTLESKRRNQQKKEWLERNPDKAEKRNKYFQEYREEHREKHKEYCANYYKENKDAINEQKKKYNEKNKEVIKDRRKKYYEDNKEKILAERKVYRENNKEKISALHKAWETKNSEYVKEKHKQYYSDNRERLRQHAKDTYDPDKQKDWWNKYNNSKRGKSCHHASHYRNYDKERGFDNSNSITSEWIENNIFTSKCVYCGDDNWKHLGADRIDNSKPHTEDNVVCSCGVCNVERNLRGMSVEEFIEYRKTHPRVLKMPKLQEIVEVNGKKVIRKAVL